MPTRNQSEQTAFQPPVLISQAQVKQPLGLARTIQNRWQNNIARRNGRAVYTAIAEMPSQ